jgi:hypothetical protein
MRKSVVFPRGYSQLVELICKTLHAPRIYLVLVTEREQPIVEVLNRRVRFGGNEAAYKERCCLRQ